MDKELLIKHKLTEAHRQFMRLAEGYLATDLYEDGEDDTQTPGPEGGDMPPMGGGQGQEAGMGDSQALQGDTSMPPADGVGDDDMGGEMPQGSPLPPMDDDELQPEEDDDVLDVEDLTQAQEKLNKKQNSIGHDLGEVDNRIIALLTAVEKIQGSLEKNNNDIQTLKAELERRMPTRTEKMNMQSLKMYPYNVNPKDYWNEKEKEGVYQAEFDSQEPKVKKEFTITQDDVDNYNKTEIEDSFDDELHQTMKDIFKGF